jgi:murein DD-endopeptidase MepM/ murein hydrolase activator NlpD
MLKIVFIIFIFNISNSFAIEHKFSFPLNCKYGENCYIQNYVDLNLTQSHQDYKCGFLSYNKHKGTDFRLIDFSHMKQNISVFASKSGTIKSTRNNQEEFIYFNDKTKLEKGKECGNGVVISHENGFESQYCHMQKNSIKASPGDKIKQGDIIGYVGMSGKTEFPHLHISFRKNGKTIDPFTGEFQDQQTLNCQNLTTQKSLWNFDTKTKLKYINTAILDFNITDKIPNRKDTRYGKFKENQLNQNSKYLILWANLMGIKKADKIHFNIKDKAGNIVFQNTQTMKKNYAEYFLYTGKKLKSLNLKKDIYSATIKIKRNNKIIKTKIKPFIMPIIHP